MRSKLLQSMTSVIALLALSAFVAGGALAQDSKPKIRGNFGSAFGWKTVDALGADNRVESDGVFASIEANLFFEGSNGPISYQYRMRFRGIDNQEVVGKSNLFVGNSVQVFRGYARWHVADTFDITIGKYGATRQSSTTENDPVQNFPYPLFTADAADRGMIDLTIKFTGGIVGIMIYNGTAGNMSTNGAPRFDGGRGGGSNADDENLTLNPYFNWKGPGGIGIGARAAISSGTMLGTGPTGDDEDFDATGFGFSVEFPLGGVGKLNLDFEIADSDLSTDPTVNFGAGVASEEESIGFGALLIIAGLRVGFAQLTQEVGPAEFEQTNISAHYRFDVGKKAWVAPEIQMQTKELTGVTLAPVVPDQFLDDEEQTTFRLLFQIGF